MGVMGISSHGEVSSHGCVQSWELSSHMRCPVKGVSIYG